MESIGAVSVSQTPSKQKHTTKSENINPNSPAIRSGTKFFKSPKNRLRDRKFIVKKHAKRETVKSLSSVDCKCESGASKCLCVAYESLRASQEGFFKNEGKEIEDREASVSVLNEGGKCEEGEGVEILGEKRRLDVLGNGSGRVMDLVKAFENILTLPKSTEDVGEEKEEEEEEEKKRDSEWGFSSTFDKPEFLLNAENLGLRVTSSLDGSRGSRGRISNKNLNGGRHSRRNSSESSSSLGGGRWKRRTARSTSLQPFKLRTEQRGRLKEEEFMKKVKKMMIEQEKLRIPVAQGLPWTTDEPECLVKPPVKESTEPIDLVLHSDVRAVERAGFDHQVQEKLSYIEQYKLEKERLQKLEEEEELRRLRKELVPKAQPMPYFDRPFVPRRSEKQPTIPKEPKFHNHPHKKICSSMCRSVI